MLKYIYFFKYILMRVDISHKINSIYIFKYILISVDIT